jgi:AraC-like DNA-binding protein
MPHIPTSRFDYRELPPAERLPAFRQMTASLYQTWALGNPKDFRCDALGYLVQDLIFTEVKFSAARFQRGDAHTQGDGKDFLTLHAQVAGTERHVMGHGVVQLLPGNIYLRDWAYPYDCRATPMHLHTIVVPRHRLASSALLDRHNPILSWNMSDPEGHMLLKLWSDLVESFARITLEQAQILAEGLLGFIDGLLGGYRRKETPVTLHTMERYLTARLRREVGVEDLCRRFRTSRATVYRLFEPHGGVRSYLSRARLERAYADLCRADPRDVQISEIAAAWQYHEPSVFSRKFRAQFGQSPSEVLGCAWVDPVSRPPGTIQGAEMYEDYMRWFNNASSRR